jgi:hypothetical protein
MSVEAFFRTFEDANQTGGNSILSFEPKPERTLVISHWAKLFTGLCIQPTALYDLVEEAVKSREVPDCDVSRVDWHEGGAFSANREYLRLNRGKLDFYICAAPYGSGFFVSSRLTTPSGVDKRIVVPASILGFFILALLFYQMFGFFGIILAMGVAVAGVIFILNMTKLTFYRIDTAQMFQQAVHQALMEAIDQVTKTAGIAPLSEAERKPVMHELFR